MKNLLFGKWVCVALVLVLQGCTQVPAYQRGNLSKPEMAWSPDTQDATLSKHIYFAKKRPPAVQSPLAAAAAVIKGTPMTQAKTTPHRLLALSAAALALPALAPQAIAVAPTETVLSYRYSQYREQDLDSSMVSRVNENNGGASTERYSIDVNQYGFSTPVGEHFAFSLEVQDETLSGATPWATIVNKKGTPSTSDDSVQVVMSGASIREHRTEANTGMAYFYNGGSFGASLGTSQENDYSSYSGGVNWGGEFDEKLTGVSVGFSGSTDTVDPTRKSIPGRGGWINGSDPIAEGATAKKQSFSSYISASRILNPNSIVQGGVSYTQKTGYLSDAYKANDVRPEERNQYTFNGAYRLWLKPIKSALHMDYRFYNDDWGVSSHTLSLALYKNWQKIQIIPSVRYYTQTEADFYTVNVSGQDFNYLFYSEDARLSHFGSVATGLKLVFKQKPVNWMISGEYYVSGADYAFGNSQYLENPGLVDYYKLTFGVEHRF